MIIFGFNVIKKINSGSVGDILRVKWKDSDTMKSIIKIQTNVLCIIPYMVQNI